MLIGILKDFMVTTFQCWCLFVLLSNEVCIKKWKQRVFGLFFTIIVVALSYKGTILLLKFLIIILYIVFVGRMVYLCNRKKLLVYGITYILATYCSEMLVFQIWNSFNAPVFSQNAIYEDFVLIMVILSNALLFFSVHILKNILGKSNFNRGWKETLPTIISGIPFLIVLFSIHISLPKIHETIGGRWFIASSIGIFIALIFNTLFIQNYTYIAGQKKEEENSLYELKLKNEYYLKRLKTEEQIREIYHDLKNHFLLSASGINENIKKQLEKYEQYYETGNSFLDVILADKIEKANELSIKIECNINIPHSDFLKPLDISTIFGNLLDNAIEATRKIENEEKYIFLEGAIRGKMIIVVVANPTIESGAVNGHIETTKQNKKYHGFGLLNVNRALQSYNGDMKINIKKGEFRVNLIIPIPKKNYEELE